MAEHARPAAALTLQCGRSPLGAEGKRRRHTLCMQDKRIVHSVALVLEGEGLRGVVVSNVFSDDVERKIFIYYQQLLSYVLLLQLKVIVH